MITLENGGIIKSIHGGLYKNSIWYTVYGSKGRMETAREDAENGDVSRLYINNDEYSGSTEKTPCALSTWRRSRIKRRLPLAMEARLCGHVSV